MSKRWVILSNKYDGFVKKAVNTLSGVISEYVNYVIPVRISQSVSSDDFKKSNFIIVGTGENNTLFDSFVDKGLLDAPTDSQGYSIYVGGSGEEDSQVIAILGKDEIGALYGAMEFCNNYVGNFLFYKGARMSEELYRTGFERILTEYKAMRAPAIKRRALWTWGHVIYDYRKFLENMLRLRLNELVIWNDRVPLNARDIVDYAHSLGIKVIFGYSWGWDNGCAAHAESLTDDNLETIKKNIITTYENEYKNTGCDGIYFQSFTELNAETAGGRSIAESVTALVNETAEKLLSKYPTLDLQFGLHATSVKNKLEVISKVDERITIVWEDCGAFPYAYFADNAEGFEDTLDFTDRIVTLRGERERFGTVLKGMVCLDWKIFEHFDESYVLGERTQKYLKKRSAEKDKIWRAVQSGWLKNADLARKTVALIAEKSENAVIEALCEDGLFEEKIMLPTAIYAELLFNPDENINELISRVSSYPCVDFC